MPWSTKKKNRPSRHQVATGPSPNIHRPTTSLPPLPLHFHLHFHFHCKPPRTSAVPRADHRFPPKPPLLETGSTPPEHDSASPCCPGPSHHCRSTRCHSWNRHSCGFLLHLRPRFRSQANWLPWLRDAVRQCSKLGCAGPNDVRDSSTYCHRIEWLGSVDVG